MPTLRSLTEDVDVDSHLAWVAASAFDDVERVHPKTVTSVHHRDDTIMVTAEGIGGGRYFYTVDDAGDSEAFFVNPEKDYPTLKGSVAFAELTDSDELVRVKRGYFDSRGD